MKKLSSVFENKKESIINQVIGLLPTALSGDPANRTFFINKKGTVNYHYYNGQMTKDDSCFYTIKNNETPDPEDYGYESLDEMDFDDIYREEIEEVLCNHIMHLNIYENA